MEICPKCGEVLEKEYIQGANGGYDIEVHSYCTKCEYEKYEK